MPSPGTCRPGRTAPPTRSPLCYATGSTPLCAWGCTSSVERTQIPACVVSVCGYRSFLTRVLCGLYMIIIVVIGLTVSLSTALTYNIGKESYYAEVRCGEVGWCLTALSAHIGYIPLVQVKLVCRAKGGRTKIITETIQCTLQPGLCRDILLDTLEVSSDEFSQVLVSLGSVLLAVDLLTTNIEETEHKKYKIMQLQRNQSSLSNIKNTQEKPRIRQRSGLRHSAKKRIGSILSTPESANCILKIKRSSQAARQCSTVRMATSDSYGKKIGNLTSCKI